MALVRPSRRQTRSPPAPSRSYDARAQVLVVSGGVCGLQSQASLLIWANSCSRRCLSRDTCPVTKPLHTSKRTTKTAGYYHCIRDHSKRQLNATNPLKTTVEGLCSDDTRPLQDEGDTNDCDGCDSCSRYAAGFPLGRCLGARGGADFRCSGVRLTACRSDTWSVGGGGT